MKPFVILNWKMNPPTFREAKKLFEETSTIAERAKKVKVIVAPPAIFVRELRAAYKKKAVSFAIQHAHAEDGKAHTGEISFEQTKDAKIAHAIIGHAERRMMGENDADVHEQVQAALKNKITAIVCVGENERGHDGEYLIFIREQLKTALANTTTAQLKQIIIVYEPLWTIGKATTMTPRDMHEMSIYIRKTVVAMHGQAGMKVPIVYGGSVDDKNAKDMMENGEVDGVLIGRASLDTKNLPILIRSIGAKA